MPVAAFARTRFATDHRTRASTATGPNSTAGGISANWQPFAYDCTIPVRCGSTALAADLPPAGFCSRHGTRVGHGRRPTDAPPLARQMSGGDAAATNEKCGEIAAVRHGTLRRGGVRLTDFNFAGRRSNSTATCFPGKIEICKPDPKTVTSSTARKTVVLPLGARVVSSWRRSFRLGLGGRGSRRAVHAFRRKYTARREPRPPRSASDSASGTRNQPIGNGTSVGLPHVYLRGIRARMVRT